MGKGSKYTSNDSTTTVKIDSHTKYGVVSDESNFYSSIDPEFNEEPISRKVSLATVDVNAVETALKGRTNRKSTK